jgi:hypothetical protein
MDKYHGFWEHQKRGSKMDVLIMNKIKDYHKLQKIFANT